MPRVLLVGHGGADAENVLRWLSGRAEVEVTNSWGRVVSALADPNPPGAMVVMSDMLSSDSPPVLHLLHRKGYLIPTAVFCVSDDPKTYLRAGRLLPLGVSVVIDHDVEELSPVLEVSPVSAAQRLARALDVSDPWSRRLLTVCQEASTLDGNPVPWVCDRLGLGRSTVYQRAREAGLPTVRSIVAFFELLPAVELLARGGRLEDATFTAGSADPTTFRRSLKARFGLSVSQVRQAGDEADIVQLWTAFQDRRPGHLAASP